MIYLNASQKEKIRRNEHSWLEFNGSRYYIKKHRTKLEYSEVVAYKVAQAFGIDCAFYHPLRYNNKLYYLSEELKDFTPSSYFHAYNASLYEYWYLFETYYPGCSEDLLLELIKVFFLDIILMNPDRNHTNWGIITKVDGPHICILDNELIFSFEPKMKLSSSYMDKANENHLKKPNYNDVDSLKELDNFLNTSSSEFISLFAELLELVKPEDMEGILQGIEEEYQDKIYNKAWYLRVYEENFAKISHILAKYTSKNR